VTIIGTHRSAEKFAALTDRSESMMGYSALRDQHPACQRMLMFDTYEKLMTA
jgi:hypothetical protein